MHERDVRRAKRSQEFQTYSSAVAGTTSKTDELARLAELKKQGDLTDEEYTRAKASLLE